MRVKTSELIGPALNWAVAQAIGTKPMYNWCAFGVTHYGAWETALGVGSAVMLQPYSTDWAQGGPIIEREHLHIGHNSKEHPDTCWQATKLGTQPWGVNEFGPTPLIAAMRCYVASKMGDSVDIPKELLKSASQAKKETP